MSKELHEHSDDELKELASCIVYEWWMLNWACDMTMHEWETFDMSPEQTYEVRCEDYDEWEEQEDGTVIRPGSTMSNGMQQANAYLECFLLHARVLKDFLICEDGNNKNWHRDDVVALHYVECRPKWEACIREWRQRNADLEQGVLGKKPQIKRLNKSLAHLSVTRLKYRDEEDREWNVTQIKTEIKELWNMFLQALPPERRAWFDPHIERMEAINGSTS